MPKLFDCIEIRGLLLKNRIVAPPIATTLSSEKGLPTRDTIDHYSKLAESGVGLAILEHHAVHSEGKVRTRQPLLDRDEVISFQKELVTVFSSREMPVFVQINHAGSLIQDKDILNGQWLPKGPSPVSHPCSQHSLIPTELSKTEIYRFQQLFADASIRAKKAGYKGVEIHAAHGYLLGQFISPKTNNRSDTYGGKIQNRARLLFEVYEAVRSAVGDEIIVAVRLGMADTLPGDRPSGQTIEDGCWIARELAAKGLDLLDLSGNMCRYQGKGNAWFAPQCRVVKETVGKIPTICTGGIKDAKTAQQLLFRGVCDLVGVGRTLFSNPELIQKWREDAKINYCTNRSPHKGSGKTV